MSNMYHILLTQSVFLPIILKSLMQVPCKNNHVLVLKCLRNFMIFIIYTMLLFILCLRATSKFYIKQSTDNSFLSKLNDRLILSGFYSPIEFEFSYSNEGHLNFKDAVINKKLILNDETIAVEKSISRGDGAFKIVFDGESRFFIMKNNKCLEAETGSLIPKRKYKVVFKKCKFQENQLWTVFMKSNKIVNPSNVISNYYNHNKHIVYAHTLDGRTPLHGFYYHNYNKKNVVLYHHHRDNYSILKQRFKQKISERHTPFTDF